MAHNTSIVNEIVELQMDRPNTVAELMRMATDAIVERDEEKLQMLIGVSHGWMQSEEECRAQTGLLEAIMEMMGELTDYES